VQAIPTKAIVDSGAWALDSIVATRLAGGRENVVRIGEAPPPQAEMIKTTPRMINIFISFLFKFDLLG
jgi:hypothetical protein